MHPTPLATRILRSVDKSGDCWLWLKSLDNQGYGQVRELNRMVRAHRAAYECFVGPIPAGLVVDHLCRTLRCVNPAHLEAVTQRENLRRAVRAPMTACRAGHERNDENSRPLKSNPTRIVCLVCARATAERYRERKAQRNDPR